MIWYWLVHYSGIDNGVEYGRWVWYNFWSGFGSDFGEITIFAAIVAMFRKHNCHVKGCWRIGKHPLDGTPFVVCRVHHPDIPDKAPTHAQILEQYRSTNAGEVTGAIDKET